MNIKKLHNVTTITSKISSAFAGVDPGVNESGDYEQKCSYFQTRLIHTTQDFIILSSYPCFYGEKASDNNRING